MSRSPRRNHSAAFKAKVALEAVKGDKTIAEIAQKHDSIRIRSPSGGASCSSVRLTYSPAAPRVPSRRRT